MTPEPKNLIVVLGPTASGKTSLAARLAHDFHGEIISADSRQVYRGMDIGTGKDLEQYHVGGKAVKYHLIDIMDPSEEFSVYTFQKLFYATFDGLRKRHVLPILVGGTGLYLEAILLGYDMPPIEERNQERELMEKDTDELRRILSSFSPKLHNTTDWMDKKRLIQRILIEQAKANGKSALEKPKINAAVFGIRWERAELRKRIVQRLQERLEKGLIREVEELHRKGIPWERLDSFGLEYRFVSAYLRKQMTYEEMVKGLAIAIGQFAKRQETWFRRMEKRGISIEWIKGANYEELKEKVQLCLKDEG